MYLVQMNLNDEVVALHKSILLNGHLNRLRVRVRERVLLLDVLLMRRVALRSMILRRRRHGLDFFI